MRYSGTSQEMLQIETVEEAGKIEVSRQSENVMTILWNVENEMRILIDDVEFNLLPGQLIFLTEFHKVFVKNFTLARLIRFNRSFYCIIDHDQEVSCKGLLFFGASQVPVINITPEETEKFDILWRMLCIEMESRDNLQKEMLQMMIKRLIILSTRLYKEQKQLKNFDQNRLDIIREFNYLVEMHFRTRHSVAEYAELLNKSPKTLSNLFSQYKQKNPLQVIQDRIMLEARRQLYHTDKTVKEIAYETGFEDIQSFSRFFKGQEGISPKEYKEKVKPMYNTGRIANSLGSMA